MVLFLVNISGCSRKKNSFTRRFYHNNTALYNGYFNAREIVKKRNKSIERAHREDFYEIIPVFIEPTEEAAQAYYPDLDKAILKCSKVIDRHSMYIKKKEHNKWIDDAYMLVGECRYYKGEYFGALEIFEYVAKAYKDQPVRTLAQTWQARTYLKMEDYRSAFNILEKIENDGLFYAEHKGIYNAVYADYHLKRNEKDGAIEKIENAYRYTRKVKKKRRYAYILAQLHHRDKFYEQAYKFYDIVLDLRPDYRMEFNARLNRAKAYDVKANNSDKIKKELKKMLRDKKNLEFQDQIYFAMAELAFREGNDSLGIDYLKSSVKSSQGNRKQKAEAYLMLGNIYFDKPHYINAQAYYDSCLAIVSETHRSYDKIKDRHRSLTDLVSHLNVVTYEDSVQRLVGMSEKERTKMINKLIKAYIAEEERKKQELAEGFALNFQNVGSQTSTGTAGKWYFYNETTKSFGVTDFLKIWGERKLEDHWRRSNRQQVVFNTNEEEFDTEEQASDTLSPKDPEYYLSQLPFSDSAQKVSHFNILNSLYYLGLIFKEDFNDYPRSEKHFLRLVTDYDTSELAVVAYYQLFRIAILTDQSAKSTKYKDIILEKFPYSEYARIIKNPSYLKEKRTKDEKIESFYNATYQLYEYEQYDDVISTCESANDLFGKNKLTPQFDFLKALAIGRSKSRAAFKTALEDVVVNHAGEEVEEEAKKILDKLKQEKTVQAEPEIIFSDELEDKHLFVMLFPSSSNLNEIQLAISDFNISYFGTSRLEMKSTVFGKNYQMISVQNFDDKITGMNYYNTFVKNNNQLNQINSQEYPKFIITAQNYSTLYKEKKVKNYLDFFANHYLN